MDENITENIEKDATAEEAISESAAEETINNETVIEAEGESTAAEAVKPKSKMFIVYIAALVVFLAVAATALVGFGLYANNLVHGDEEASCADYSVEFVEE